MGRLDVTEVEVNAALTQANAYDFVQNYQKNWKHRLVKGVLHFLVAKSSELQLQEPWYEIQKSYSWTKPRQLWILNLRVSSKQPWIKHLRAELQLSLLTGFPLLKT